MSLNDWFDYLTVTAIQSLWLDWNWTLKLSLVVILLVDSTINVWKFNSKLKWLLKFEKNYAINDKLTAIIGQKAFDWNLNWFAVDFGSAIFETDFDSEFIDWINQNIIKILGP